MHPYRQHIGSSGSSKLRRPWSCPAVAAVAAAASLFLTLAKTCAAVEGFSSFTFGSIPGGEPRFSFNGFNPGGMGGMGGGGGAAVDNEGYYKVMGVIEVSFCVARTTHVSVICDTSMICRGSTTTTAQQQYHLSLHAVSICLLLCIDRLYSSTRRLSVYGSTSKLGERHVLHLQTGSGISHAPTAGQDDDRKRTQQRWVIT